MAKKWSEVRAGLSPVAQTRSAAHAEAMLVELELVDLRRARDYTQMDVAQAMNKEQAAVSKLERRDDMDLSTLQGCVALTGSG